MKPRDLAVALLFVMVLMAMVVTVTVVLHDRMHRASHVDFQHSQLRFCYPNQGTGAC